MVYHGATIGEVTSLGPLVCPEAYTTASTSREDDLSTMVIRSHSDFDCAICLKISAGGCSHCLYLNAGTWTVDINSGGGIWR